MSDCRYSEALDKVEKLYRFLEYGEGSNDIVREVSNLLKNYDIRRCPCEDSTGPILAEDENCDLCGGHGVVVQKIKGSYPSSQRM